MTVRDRSWLVSLGLHLLVGALVLALVFGTSPPAPTAVRMHLVGGKTSRGPAEASRGPAWTPPAVSEARPGEVPAPAWQEGTRNPGSAAPRVSAPALLDELLAGIQAGGASEVPDPVAAPSGGWAGSSGDGYVPPPLPPPRLAPPQGAHWTLILDIPGAGGLASGFEGLDSGHPDLDQWLEAYLRTVSFPAGLDGSDYKLKWDLRLQTGKPR